MTARPDSPAAPQPTASRDSCHARRPLTVAGRSLEIFALDAVPGTDRLPYGLKVLTENLLRTEDGRTVTADHIAALASWDPAGTPSIEIPFTPGRVLMQDFTGVPAVVDLAAMREAMVHLGGDPALINPLAPADLVIDHSVVADVFGRADAFQRNVELEYRRNGERYQFLRWGQSALSEFRVVPPGTGIVHQVNIEHLAPVVMVRGGQAYPDTLVGTDSHSTMANGLGVVGWGVGGIEAEAAMLGQPISMLIPRVVGIKLSGTLPEGATATDLVLTITQLLREHGVVGAFVEFYGPGVAAVPLANRATIGNMSPEYGSTVALFPIDDVTLRYLRMTGRSADQVALVEAYAKTQGLWHDPAAEPLYNDRLQLDLSTIEPSLAGPRRPQDRVPLRAAKEALRGELTRYVKAPASAGDRPRHPTQVTFDAGEVATLDHGDVVIAAITSCTNTSNPSVMVAAGLVAKKAVERGLSRQPWVKTSLAPGSRVVMDYYERAGLTPYLDRLGFNVVGFGCTTCIGNSGPLIPEVSSAVNASDLAVVSVLSGNRNFEGRINPDVKLNYLASPPLVVIYALTGTMDIDLATEPVGIDPSGAAVYLPDLWPSDDEVASVVAASLGAEEFSREYADVFTGDERWRSLQTPHGHTFAWDPSSTYVRRPPYFDGMLSTPAPVTDIESARILAILGDSVTTDHISPAGSIKADSPAGRWLEEHGVERREFNSYGSRRGNHEVMIRGTFANIRLRNLMLDEVEGGFTRDFTAPDAPTVPIYDAAVAYAKERIPLVVVAGAEYGSGSSRDWAAKGTALLGVRAVIAQSYERIHRSNLIGMGVLPLQFVEGESAQSLQLTGEESVAVQGVTALTQGDVPKHLAVSVTRPDGTSFDIQAVVRIDTPREADYYRNGGILPFVLRSLLDR